MRKMSPGIALEFVATRISTFEKSCTIPKYIRGLLSVEESSTDFWWYSRILVWSLLCRCLNIAFSKTHYLLRRVNFAKIQIYKTWSFIWMFKLTAWSSCYFWKIPFHQNVCCILNFLSSLRVVVEPAKCLIKK